MARTILITGTSRGTGLALAQRFLNRGDNVIGVSRGKAVLEDASYRHFRLDISDEGAVRSLFAALKKSNIRVDALLNNAGFAVTMPAVLTGAKQFKDVLDTNLLGAFLMTREALKSMLKADDGRVLFFTSINVPLTSAGAVAYNAAKAGLEGVMGTFARELKGTQVTVNAIGLSLVEHSGMLEGLSEKALQQKQDVLLKPDLLSDGEILHAIDFFLDHKARNITGQTLFFGGVR